MTTKAEQRAIKKLCNLKGLCADALDALQEADEIMGVGEIQSLWRQKWKVVIESLHTAVYQPEPTDSELNTCPGCGGVADNGFDRCIPPNPYYCTKCMNNLSKTQK